MEILKHLDQENLHHAYLIEGESGNILPHILDFVKNLGIAENSPDFCHIVTDNFKIDDAFALKSMSGERSTTSSKKIFVISANHFSPDAQNTMLKLFEEPIKDTHFFVITPDPDALFKTLVSRFYLIRTDGNKEDEIKTAEKFLSMSLSQKIDFIKELLIEPDDEIGEDGIRAKALKFLNILELALHQPHRSNLWGKKNVQVFEQIMKARVYLRQPGSSSKTLLESVALLIPDKI